jgi:hypothetical protein
MSAARRCVRLLKGRHQYVFVCPVGCERELLASILDFAADPRSELSWLDAALIGCQLDVYEELRPCDAPAF